jgi:TPR repeat protein
MPGTTNSLLANAWYDYACAAAVAGHRDQAFEYLQKAADLGDGDIAAKRPAGVS